MIQKFWLAETKLLGMPAPDDDRDDECRKSRKFHEKTRVPPVEISRKFGKSFFCQKMTIFSWGRMYGGKTCPFFGFLGPKNPSFKPPKWGVLKPITPASTGKKVEKWPRGAVFSPFPKISPPVRQK